MATQLKPFLTNIANAIRTKKGTTAPINAQNFASEIASIESGGVALTGYSGTIKFNGLTNYDGISYLVVHSNGTYNDNFSVSATNNVNDVVYIVIYMNLKYELAGANTTNVKIIGGNTNTITLWQTTGDNWVLEFDENI